MASTLVSVVPYSQPNARRTLHLQLEWGMDELLNAAGRRLDMISSPTRCFTSDGLEVTDVMMLVDGATIFVSCERDDSVAVPTVPRVKENECSKACDINDGSGLPSMVGGYMAHGDLGRGGFGQVRLGRYQLTDERVALKFLPKSEIQDMMAAERTISEMCCLMALRHPNIITLMTHIDMPKHVVLAFELMEGGDLLRYLKSLPTGKLDEEPLARMVFHQIASGVAHAHNSNICHRDLKLDNVLLQHSGRLNSIKVADFGLSSFYQPGKRSRVQCGSLNYVAPEVLRGTATVDPPRDMWGLGVILFAILQGRLPFDGSKALSGDDRETSNTIIRKTILTPSYRVDENISSKANDFIHRMLSPDPNKRITFPEVFTHCWVQDRNIPSRSSMTHQKKIRDTSTTKTSPCKKMSKTKPAVSGPMPTNVRREGRSPKSGSAPASTTSTIRSNGAVQGSTKKMINNNSSRLSKR